MTRKQMLLGSVLCVLAQNSSVWAVMIGDFEGEIEQTFTTADGGHNFGKPTLELSDIGVTSGAQSMKCWMDPAAAINSESYKAFAYIQLKTGDMRDQFHANKQLSFDVTLRAEDWADFAGTRVDFFVIFQFGKDPKWTPALNKNHNWYYTHPEGRPGWHPDEGDTTLTIGVDYSELKEMIDSRNPDIWDNAFSVQRIMFVRTPGGSAGNVFYLDNVRLSGADVPSDPIPADEANEVPTVLPLRWSAGTNATSHQLYLGTDMNDVNEAVGDSNANVLYQELTTNYYEPAALDPNTQYFWRAVDLATDNPESPWAGPVWTFTTGDFVSIDEFEVYGVMDADIDAGITMAWDTWLDGYEDPSNGSRVGHAFEPYMQSESGAAPTFVQSMPLYYDNTVVGHSQIDRPFETPQDFAADGRDSLSLWFKGRQGPSANVTFAEDKFAVAGAGADISGSHDEFVYVYKTAETVNLIARIDAQEDTHGWAKAGIMLRSQLVHDAAYIFCFITPKNGVAVELRTFDGGVQSGQFAHVPDVAVPHWLRMELNQGGVITCWHSVDGENWQSLMDMANTFLPKPAYAGLAMTSHNSKEINTTVFSNVSVDGVPWTLAETSVKEIGTAYNTEAPFYVLLKDSSGKEGKLVQSATSVNVEAWTQWTMPLQQFTEQGVNVGSISQMSIGLGDPAGAPADNTSGMLLIDAIRLNLPDVE